MDIPSKRARVKGAVGPYWEQEFLSSFKVLKGIGLCSLTFPSPSCTLTGRQTEWNPDISSPRLWASWTLFCKAEQQTKSEVTLVTMEIGGPRLYWLLCRHRGVGGGFPICSLWFWDLWKQMGDYRGLGEDLWFEQAAKTDLASAGGSSEGLMWPSPSSSNSEEANSSWSPCWMPWVPCWMPRAPHCSFSKGSFS